MNCRRCIPGRLAEKRIEDYFSEDNIGSSLTATLSSAANDVESVIQTVAAAAAGAANAVVASDAAASGHAHAA